MPCVIRDVLQTPCVSNNGLVHVGSLTPFKKSASAVRVVLVIRVKPVSKLVPLVHSSHYMHWVEKKVFKKTIFDNN